MTVNPYAAPAETGGDAVPDSFIRVDGDRLVVGPVTALPQRCVLTDQPAEEEDRIIRILEWTPSLRLVLRPRTCRLAYYLDRHHRCAVRRKLAIATVLVVGVPVLPSMVYGWGVMLLLVPLLAVVLGQTRVDPIRVTDCRDRLFWIAGCGPEFLESCRREFGTY